MPTHITARLAWHNDEWNGTICKAPEQNTYCVGCKSFPGDVIGRERDLDTEKRLAGRSGDKLETHPTSSMAALAGTNGRCRPQRYACGLSRQCMRRRSLLTAISTTISAGR